MNTTNPSDQSPVSSPAITDRPSRYESQKRRDWNTFGQYLRNHRPPLSLSLCSGANVLEFLRYIDQFGKTKVHSPNCPFFGHPHPPAPCPCPLRQAWGSLDALVGRLRAAFEENGGQPEANPFGARAVRLYLREVRDSQAKARGIAYLKKKRKKPASGSSNGVAADATSAGKVEGEIVMMGGYGQYPHHVHGHGQGQFGNLMMGVGVGGTGDEVVMAAMVEAATAHNSGGGFIPLSVFH